jgi:hypothetical protein
MLPNTIKIIVPITIPTEPIEEIKTNRIPKSFAIILGICWRIFSKKNDHLNDPSTTKKTIN